MLLILFVEEGTTFGQIVAVFGAILIGVGIAWLVATNWHSMAPWLKILILFVATAAAYAAGAVLREHGHDRIGAALLILGALLYTLSVFLIAQIYSTSTTVQGFAWLLLLCWAGVAATAYVFGSGGTLLVGIIEFLVWLPLQYFALAENTYVGAFALLLLAAGALFYGLSLLHKEHRFNHLYRYVAIIYILAYAYVLSFQIWLSLLWSRQFSIAPKALSFLIAFGIIAAGVLAAGIALRSRKAPQKSTPGNLLRYEIIGACATLGLLALLVLLAAWPADAIGECRLKQCYDLKEESACQAAPQDMRCSWQGAGWGEGYCGQIGCYSFGNQSACEAAPINCTWQPGIAAKEARASPQSVPAIPAGACIERSCYIYSKEQCAAQGCLWDGYTCQPDTCYIKQNSQECEAKGCLWSGYNCIDKNACNADPDIKSSECRANAECTWQTGSFSVRTRDMPAPAWVVWVLINLAFLAIIIGVIAYGTLARSPAIINLGIAVFILDIITRYIGFIMDLQGYNALALIFITGGLILIVGGYFIEKWRRNLVEKARSTDGSQ